ncbi:MAG: M23 family metallopeptidase [Flavobacteriales bacterium]|nr:M23 family metallopeptidase [Flavobacteriales bacterium]
MSKTKYKYNPDTLSYDEVEVTWGTRLKKLSFHLVSGVVFSIILILLSYSTIKRWGRQEAERDLNIDKLELEEFNKKVAFAQEVLEDIEKRDTEIYRALFNADPYPDYKRIAGTGGNPNKYKNIEGTRHEDLIIKVSEKIEQLEKSLVAQSRSFDEVVSLVKRKEEMLKCIPSIQPISNKDLTRLASGFGMRMHPVHRILKMHTGLDFTASIGTNIYATGDGVVVRADSEMSGYGKLVIIDHGFGYETRYAHCHEYKVKVGQKVKKGDVIALLGNTGVSTGPHVHYEVRKNGNPVDPVHYFFNDLTPEEYEKVIEIASRPTSSM